MFAVRNFSRGFSLLEVLLAWLLVSTILLGMYEVLLQQKSNLTILSQQLLANIQLTNLFERLRMGHAVSYRAQQKISWHQETQYLLPAAVIQDALCRENYCKACILWQNSYRKPLCLAAQVPGLPYWN